jgi:hypothetical protein
VVLAAADKVQMAQAAVRAELQILGAAVAAAMLIPVALVALELSLFDTEFRMAMHYFHLMQMAAQAVTHHS